MFCGRTVSSTKKDRDGLDHRGYGPETDTSRRPHEPVPCNTALLSEAISQGMAGTKKKMWQKEMLSYRSLNANRYCTHLHLEPSSELETQSREVGHGRALLRCLVTDLFAKGREGQLAGRDAKWEIYFCLKLVWFFCFLLSENVNLIDKVFCTGSKTKALSHPQTHNFLLIEIPSLITSCCKWSSYDH